MSNQSLKASLETLCDHDDQLEHYLITHLADTVELMSSLMLLQIAEGDNGKSASLETLSLVPLVERQQCDACASCITDVHRTCKECGYDVCVRCCRGLREQGQVKGTHITCLQH